VYELDDVGYAITGRREVSAAEEGPAQTGALACPEGAIRIES
jgi:ferredoxin